MKLRQALLAIQLICVSTALPSLAQTNNQNNPTWWSKLQYLVNHPPANNQGPTTSVVGVNVDVSNECGPQSEAFITLNPAQSSMLAAGSNEIFRLQMRGYFSSDGGSKWGGIDLPLPQPLITNGIRFGSDPSLAFDTRGDVFYSYIVVFFNRPFKGVTGTELAVARSSDGGQTYPQITLFSFKSGSGDINDKPMIAIDTNLNSRFRDNIYVAWDIAPKGNSAQGIRLANSSDHGASFAITRVDTNNGAGKDFGALPFVGPDGEVYVAWNDFGNNLIAFNRSFDGGTTWDKERTIASKTAVFVIPIPAESFRGADVYPACDADRSNGPHRGRLFCSWMDTRAAGNTDIFLSFSDDQGASWSSPRAVADQLPVLVDRWNHWMSVDPVTGDVNISFYDTRNDTTGFRYAFDTYFTRSTDGGATWLSPNVRVSTQSSNEHDCNGVFPCSAIDYGNQQGDYEGLASFGGVSHPVWTDSRRQLGPSSGCSTNLLMEEVFTAVVR
jgi:hypothetical protein